MTKSTKISPRSLLRMSLPKFLEAAAKANGTENEAVFEEAAKVILQQIGDTPAKAPRKSTGGRHLAAVRAHRSRVVAKLPGTRGKVRAELKAQIARYDAMLSEEGVELPAEPKQPRRAKSSRDGHKAAIRAHRSRVASKLTGTRGKVRAELQARLARYDELLAA